MYPVVVAAGSQNAKFYIHIYAAGFQAKKNHLSKNIGAKRYLLVALATTLVAPWSTVDNIKNNVL